MKRNVPKLRFNGFEDEWKEKKLGEIVTLMQSGLSRKLENSDVGVPVLRSNNLINGKVDINDVKYWYEKDDQGANLENYFLKTNDLLINFINSLAQIGKSAIYKDELKRKTIFTTNIMRLNFDSNTNVEYIFNYFQLNYYNNFIQSITKPAVNQASFTTSDFKNFNIKLPSLQEQEKIANFLSKVDSLIEEQDSKVTDLEKYKKGMMQKIFSQEIRFKDDNGCEYPEWEEKKLGEVTKLTDGVHFTPEYVEEGVPFWSVETIVSGAKPKFITEEAHNLAIKRCFPEKNDILMTRIGTLAKSIVLNNYNALSIYVSVALIKSSKIFNSKFLKQYFDSEEYNKEFLSKSLLTATPKKINMEDLKATKIKLPCLEEQNKIANFLSNIDIIIEEEKGKLEDLRQWKKGLLQQMFV